MRWLVAGHRMSTESGSRPIVGCRAGPRLLPEGDDAHDSQRCLMTAGPTGAGARSPDRESEPTEGLRLRLLPAVSEPAFPLDHDYFEIAYTPLVGPTAVLLARAMARHLDAAAGPTTACPIELALEVGIRAGNGNSPGRRSHLVRALDRLVHAHIVVRLGDRIRGVRSAMPPLSNRALRKLPASAREAHVKLVGAMGSEAPPLR